MAIIPTGAIYKTLNFDGQSSGTYGVYITGDAVFNAPERDVEMVKIPGRNGAFALDNGRFENIEVTYPAGIFAETEADFAAAISDFRNYLCSRKGYCRLTDDYNPDEYRLGIYKSGLEVNPEFLKAGQFNITFECKPQRYLTTGENPITVTDGDTLTNPTYFESGPLLEIDGYGTISFNGYEIELDDDLVGDVFVRTHIDQYTNSYSVTFPDVYINPGDQIQVNDAVIVLPYRRRSGNRTISSKSNTSTSGDGTVAYSSGNVTSFTMTATFTTPLTFSYGTEATKEITYSFRLTYDNGTYDNFTFKFQVSYDGNKTITFYTPASYKGWFEPYNVEITSNEIIIHSTATTYGHPTYIDCDIGEAYADDNGVISSLNSYIDLGSYLPKLAPGSNTITFDNTVTDLKITPRWWKV